jgi:hypothetical protein
MQKGVQVTNEEESYHPTTQSESVVSESDLLDEERRLSVSFINRISASYHAKLRSRTVDNKFKVNDLEFGMLNDIVSSIDDE